MDILTLKMDILTYEWTFYPMNGHFNTKNIHFTWGPAFCHIRFVIIVQSQLFLLILIAKIIVIIVSLSLNERNND